MDKGFSNGGIPGLFDSYEGLVGTVAFWGANDEPVTGRIPMECPSMAEGYAGVQHTTIGSKPVAKRSMFRWFPGGLVGFHVPSICWSGGGGDRGEGKGLSDCTALLLLLSLPPMGDCAWSIINSDPTFITILCKDL
jgi:hypothetical protein